MKILAQRPTHISTVATVQLIIKTLIVKYYDTNDRQTETETDRQTDRQRQTHRDRHTESREPLADPKDTQHLRSRQKAIKDMLLPIFQTLPTSQPRACPCFHFIDLKASGIRAR